MIVKKNLEQACVVSNNEYFASFVSTRAAKIVVVFLKEIQALIVREVVLEELSLVVVLEVEDLEEKVTGSLIVLT